MMDFLKRLRQAIRLLRDLKQTIDGYPELRPMAKEGEELLVALATSATKPRTKLIVARLRKELQDFYEATDTVLENVRTVD